MDDFDPLWGGIPRFKVSDAKWVDPRCQNDKREYPYSYSEFFHFGNRIAVQGLDADYSDRLWQADPAKYEKLQALVGCRFEQARPEQLDAFLSAYWGKPIVVAAFAEGCNPSSGYPYYIFWYAKP